MAFSIQRNAPPSNEATTMPNVVAGTTVSAFSLATAPFVG
jgi:hypothetical protein